MRRGVALLAVVAFCVGGGAETALAHTGLEVSDPRAGATLGDSPTAVRLTFSEQPQASLSSIRVLGAGGRGFQTGRAEPVSGDPLSLVVPVRRLARGVYTVRWRAVSAVDGHATSGSFTFGVQVSPGAAATTRTTSAVASPLEMLARFAFLAGLIALIGAGAAAVGRFGGSHDARLAAGGWILSLAGLVLLAEAQRRNAAASLHALLGTPVGHALVWRAVALAIAGGGLLLARRTKGLGLAVAGSAALGAVAVHVAAGHAAAGSWPPALTIAAQSMHIAAAGVWIGGLAALILGTHAPAAIRRFAVAAAVGLVVVAATGTVRAVDELSSAGDLVSTGYGRTILVKVALLLTVAGLALRSRRLAGLGRLGPTAKAELAIAAAAIAAAAVLGTLSPPSSGRLSAPAGLDASGSTADVRVRLTTASPEPGPNRFVAHVSGGYPERLTLRFTPLDDPGVPPTSLELRPTPDGTFAGTGANLAFDGRWGVRVLVEGPNAPVSVPLELDAQGPAQFISIERRPGLAPKYTVYLANNAAIRVSPDPERAGPSRLFVTIYGDVLGDPAQVRRLVVTVADHGTTRQEAVRRIAAGRFVASAELAAGHDTVAVVARTTDGTRLRAVVVLDVPTS